MYHLCILRARRSDEPDLEALASQNIFPDVNNDGTVDIIDLLIVASEIGSTDNSAPMFTNNLVGISSFTAANLTQWINFAKRLEIKDRRVLSGIEVLERLLEHMLTLEVLPKETVLLHNYPNPFNPETWIPFQLAKPATVSISIYAADGKHVRQLELGQLPAGVYQDKPFAGHWDGKNKFGESVASGVYFYTLIADDFSETRKMLIRK